MATLACYWLELTPDPSWYAPIPKHPNKKMNSTHSYLCVQLYLYAVYHFPCVNKLIYNFIFKIYAIILIDVTKGSEKRSHRIALHCQVVSTWFEKLLIDAFLITSMNFELPYFIFDTWHLASITCFKKEFLKMKLLRNLTFFV